MCGKEFVDDTKEWLALCLADKEYCSYECNKHGIHWHWDLSVVTDFTVVSNPKSENSGFNL
jgi:hypothetical protein